MWGEWFDSILVDKGENKLKDLLDCWKMVDTREKKLEELLGLIIVIGGRICWESGWV